MNSICDDCYDLFSKEFDNMDWPTEKILRGSSHTLAIHISNIVLRGEVEKLRKELNDINNNNNDDAKNEWLAEGHWDYWGDLTEEEE